ncbi:MAG: hypothetical protein GY790_22510, partial [Bacteroidetes bacterium]|nr:hypothetical protein [Bacteroidota bacterium]
MKKFLSLLSLGAIILIGCSLSLSGQFQFTQENTLTETRHQIYQATYSPDGKLIATTGSDNNIFLWSTDSWIIHRSLVGLKKRPNVLVFSTDGKFLFSAGEDGQINTWNPLLVELAHSTEGHRGSIRAMDISPDGALLASGGDDKILRIWGIKEGGLTLIYEIKGHRQKINSVAFSPDGNTLVSVGADKALLKWDMQNATNAGSIQAHTGWIRCVKYSPDGKFIATGGDDHLIQVWNASDLSPYKTLEGHTDWVQSLDFTSSGQHIVSGSHDRYIRIWDLETGKSVAQSVKQEDIVVSVDASPVKNDIISACRLREDLHIWDHKIGSIADTQAEVVPESEFQVNKVMPLDSPSQEEPEVSTDADPGSSETTGVESTEPIITLFSPEPVEGVVTHDKASILLLGKADAVEGIQTLLVNRERADIAASGFFQVTIELASGENLIDLRAISNRGEMVQTSFVIHCTDETASVTVVEQPEAEQGKYYALIIAINDYSDDKINDLDFPISDADSLYNTVIEHYSFLEENINYLKNPSRTEIIIAMDDLSRLVSPDDNLLIFYAGHGHWDDKSKLGYWLPRDANEGNTANWFRNSTLRDFIGS